MGAEVVAVLEVKLLLAALLHRHRELDAAGLGLLGHLGRAPELLVHERPGCRRIGAARERGLDALEDQMLAVREALVVLGGGIALDTEPLRE